MARIWPAILLVSTAFSAQPVRRAVIIDVDGIRNYQRSENSETVMDCHTSRHSQQCYRLRAMRWSSRR